ncbi:MAG: flagellar filament capping protein FliD [Bacteroidota bacterium]
MAFSSNSLFSLTDPYGQLIDRLIKLDSQPKVRLENKKSEQTERKQAVSKVGSKLSSLKNTLDSYLEPGASQFQPFSASSSDDSIFTASVTGKVSAGGTYSIDVGQIAKNDVKVSQEFSTSDQISNLGGNARSFRIKVGGEYVDIDGDGTGDANDEITVSGITNGDTYESVINKVAEAINNSAAREFMTASVVKQTDNTVRLSVRSKTSGLDNMIEFENDVPGNPTKTNIAEALGLTYAGGANRGQDNTTIVGDTSQGGRIYSTSELNSKFTIDGLDYERGSNSISNAIQGLTLDLKNESGSTQTLTVDTDTQGGKEAVQGFIDTYNAVVSEIRKNSFLNSETGDRGPLQRDRIFRDLIFQLQNKLSESVTSAASTDLDTIYELGLGFNQQGKLEIRNEEQLDNALTTQSTEVQNLFSATGGFAEGLNGIIDGFVGSKSVISSLESSIDSKIDNLDNQIQREEQFLERQREQYREQFTQLQQISTQAQNQMQSLQAIGSGTSQYYSQLLGSSGG